MSKNAVKQVQGDDNLLWMTESFRRTNLELCYGFNAAQSAKEAVCCFPRMFPGPRRLQPMTMTVPDVYSTFSSLLACPMRSLWCQQDIALLPRRLFT